MKEKAVEKKADKKPEKKTSSRFSGVLNRVTPVEVEPADPPPLSDELSEPDPQPVSPAPLSVVAPSEVVTPAPPTAPPAPAPSPKMGRPAGKKTNPEYTQVTVYLRKDIHRQAKKLLIDDGREFSELVDELVTAWISSPQPSGGSRV